MSLFLESASIIFDNYLVTGVLLLYLLIASYTDIKYLKIYNKFNLSLVFVRLVFILIPVYSVPFRIENLYASFIVFMIMLTFGVVFMHKMGGDIKFLTAFMLFFDIEFMFVFMAIASVVNLLYSIILKNYLLKERKKVLEENGLKCNNSIEGLNLIEKINYKIIGLLMVKQPTVDELIDINDMKLKKYKMPFAPFFLISYLILMVVYYLNK